MYSIDRSDALEYTLACLRDMPLYDQCQRTLVVDGKVDKIPYDWQTIQVPRLAGGFCWGRMWDAGVFSAKFDKVIYLDSDRMLPKHYLQLAYDQIQEDLFLFTSKHFAVVTAPTIAVCKKLLEASQIEPLLMHPDYIGRFRYEVRHEQPFHGPGKNVMSGSVAFSKKTYFRLGGVDQWYCGHGAFADSDFHMQASVGGCGFVDLGIPELHYPHKKLENGSALDDKALYRMSLDNFIYYCDKWQLPMVIAESMAVRSGIARPSSYVGKKLKEFKQQASASV
jgi:hypothetical protein